jgi:hypothetical protein
MIHNLANHYRRELEKGALKWTQSGRLPEPMAEICPPLSSP